MRFFLHLGKLLAQRRHPGPVEKDNPDSMLFQEIIKYFAKDKLI
jgi:hypothetical protein